MSNKLMPPNMAMTQIRYTHPKELGTILAFAVVGCFQGGFNRQAPINVSYGGRLQTPQMKIHLLSGLVNAVGQDLFQHLMQMERANRRIVTPDLDQTLIAYAQEHPIMVKYQALLKEVQPKLQDVQAEVIAMLKEAEAKGTEGSVVANNGKKADSVEVAEEGSEEGETSG